MMTMINPWTGIGCCLSAISLYVLKITIGKNAEILKSVTRVKQLKELEHFAVTSFMNKEVPWYLEDATGCVNVVGAQEATDFMLPFQKEVSKDDAGTIWIQQPQSGPFYVTSNTIDQLIIANHGNLARWCKYASIGFSIFGSCIIVMHTIQYILERRRQCELHKRILEEAAKESQRYIEGAGICVAVQLVLDP
ncbi:hypothetical protein TSUD_333200 [Trifolium subterraneum]|uniref:RING-type E3 ubiquitin transferase n=1 Tax=Trifolium subterraneum TaxID=3900 RepID=A0A2Z6MG73_TRISU|nr:hypothetical protein TSUD_333200 [Trifolium subterraneum]